MLKWFSRLKCDFELHRGDWAYVDPERCDQTRTRRRCGKQGYSRQLLDRRNLVVLALLVLVIAACGGGGKPTFQPLPTPTTPPDFVKYTDERNTFSIEYPADWQLNLSMMDELEELAKDIVSGKTDVSLENVGSIFFATSSDESSNTVITVESLPSNTSIDDYYEAGNRGAKEGFPSWEDHGVSSIDVGGRAAMLSTASYEMSDLGVGLAGVIRLTALTLVQGKVGWSVSCGFLEDEDAKTCESIVRTFRILE